MEVGTAGEAPWAQTLASSVDSNRYQIALDPKIVESVHHLYLWKVVMISSRDLCSSCPCLQVDQRTSLA